MFPHWPKNPGHWFDRYSRGTSEHCETFSPQLRLISDHRCCCYCYSLMVEWRRLLLLPSVENHHAWAMRQRQAIEWPVWSIELSKKKRVLSFSCVCVCVCPLLLKMVNCWWTSQCFRAPRAMWGSVEHLVDWSIAFISQEPVVCSSRDEEWFRGERRTIIFEFEDEPADNISKSIRFPIRAMERYDSVRSSSLSHSALIHSVLGQMVSWAYAQGNERSGRISLTRWWHHRSARCPDSTFWSKSSILPTTGRRPQASRSTSE